MLCNDGNMAKRWSIQKEKIITRELKLLYVTQNKSLKEVSQLLKMSEAGVYGRLIRCGIPINRAGKPGFNNSYNGLIDIPPYSERLAEFIGILLGDGSLNYYQVTVTLGTKELNYALFISSLMDEIFDVQSRILISRRTNYRVVYFGSRKIVLWLLDMGLAYNKVVAQVAIPSWCFNNIDYMKAALRGLIDTDGSIYALRSGAQISLTNRSIPLLKGAQAMLQYLGYSPSRISCYKIYLTKKADLLRYFNEIGFHNQKHIQRFSTFVKT